jgi:hypothetical protein
MSHVMVTVEVLKKLRSFHEDALRGGRGELHIGTLGACHLVYLMLSVKNGELRRGPLTCT